MWQIILLPVLRTMPTPSSTALDALAYRKETEGRQHENKNGMYVYDGDPAQYRIWKFRAEMVVVGNEEERIWSR